CSSTSPCNPSQLIQHSAVAVVGPFQTHPPPVRPTVYRLRQPGHEGQGGLTSLLPTNPQIWCTIETGRETQASTQSMVPHHRLTPTSATRGHTSWLDGQEAGRGAALQDQKRRRGDSSRHHA